MPNPSHPREVMIALMGPTGTGKSTFINLLTNDDHIRVGDDLESQTNSVSTSVYFDSLTGLSVTLVDTPGFGDSRSDITDTDILQRIATFLQESGGRKLNGIIYLHRISDPRVGGAARKNLRVFRELCGDDALANVRLVTTNWDSVGAKLGSARESELTNRVFKPLIDGGATIMRHDKGLISAQSILSTLVHQAPLTLKIQTELNAGKTLGDTSAGSVIIEEMRALQKRHGEEMADLLQEIQEAAVSNNDDLRAELIKDHQQLQQLMQRAQQDQVALTMVYVPRGSPPSASQRSRRGTNSTAVSVGGGAAADVVETPIGQSSTRNLRRMTPRENDSQGNPSRTAPKSKQPMERAHEDAYPRRHAEDYDPSPKSSQRSPNKVHKRAVHVTRRSPGSSNPIRQEAPPTPRLYLPASENAAQHVDPLVRIKLLFWNAVAAIANTFLHNRDA